MPSNLPTAAEKWLPQGNNLMPTLCTRGMKIAGVHHIVVKMGWYFNVRKTGTQLPSNLPSAAGKRLLWGNNSVPALCTSASQLLILDCTINSIEIGWYLMSEDHTQDFLHIYSILLIDVMYEAFNL